MKMLGTTLSGTEASVDTHGTAQRRNARRNTREVPTPLPGGIQLHERQVQKKRARIAPRRRQGWFMEPDDKARSYAASMLHWRLDGLISDIVLLTRSP